MIYFVLEYYVVALKAKLPQNGSSYVFPKGYHPFPFGYFPSPVPNPSPTFLILSLHNTVVGVTDETHFLEDQEVLNSQADITHRL